MTAAAAPLKLRLRPAIAKEAVVNGKTCAVELSPSFFDLNAYLSAEIVEDHPHHLCTASLAAGIDDDSRQRAFEAALERTLAEHPQRPELMEIPGASQAKVMAFRGEAPWTTANAIRLSRGGFQTSDGVVLDRYLLAVPDTSTVLFMPAVFDDAERELGIAIEAAAHAVYEAASPRDRVFPGAFLAADGMLTPIRSYGEAPTLKLNTEQSTRLDELPAPLRRPEGLPELPCATDEERQASLLLLLGRTCNIVSVLLDEGTLAHADLRRDTFEEALINLMCDAVDDPAAWPAKASTLIEEIEGPLNDALGDHDAAADLAIISRWHLRGLRTLLNQSARPSPSIPDVWTIGSAVHWSLLLLEHAALRFADGQPAAAIEEAVALAVMQADVEQMQAADGTARLRAVVADFCAVLDTWKQIMREGESEPGASFPALQRLYDLNRRQLDTPPEYSALVRHMARLSTATFTVTAQATGMSLQELLTAAHGGVLGRVVTKRRAWWKFW